EPNPSRFHLERRSSGSYAEIAQISPSANSFDDSNLIPATTYSYRIRVETAAGLSGYSNESTATTATALPAAPSNLTLTALSSSQVLLTWTNNSPDATSIRVEYRLATAQTFTDAGAASSLSSTIVSGLQASTGYSFRVRAQNGAGYSAYSNVVTF